MINDRHNRDDLNPALSIIESAPGDYSGLRNPKYGGDADDDGIQRPGKINSTNKARFKEEDDKLDLLKGIRL